ncbi:MAG: hypothetical protein ACT4N2_02295 [Hyphomicrobium sp.]
MRALSKPGAIVLSLLLIAGVIWALPSTGGEPPKAPNPDDWLLNAPDDTARFKAIQGQMRGFSASMIEVGQRYDALYDAVADKNAEFAAYQLQKIKEVIVQGYTRRPKRQGNADQIFVQGVFEPALADIKSGDAAKAVDAFQRVRKACVSCHEAEKVGFINNQPRFRRTEK